MQHEFIQPAIRKEPLSEQQIAKLNDLYYGEAIEKHDLKRLFLINDFDSVTKVIWPYHEWKAKRRLHENTSRY